MGAGGPWEQLAFSVEAARKRWQTTVSNSAHVEYPGAVVHIGNLLKSLQKPRKCRKAPEVIRFLQRIRLPLPGIGISSDEKVHNGLDGRVQESLRVVQDEVVEEQRTKETWSDQGSEKFGRGFGADLILQLPGQVSSGGAVSKEDLGRATWTFLHTLAAQYPERPTRQQQRDVKELMSIMTRLYPCKICAEHFKEVLKAYPVKTDSGVELAQWMCQVHNVVNRSLGKPQFPCQRVDARWGELHCDEGACALEGRLLYK